MKRLVVCCDGTWSTLDRLRPTNVVLAARGVANRDADGNPQIVFYDDGVGVNLGAFNPIDATTGAGLDFKILEAYEFLTFNYEPGDQLYFFGYSRGAYTVRSLVGLIRKCGILQRRHADLARDALELYRRPDIKADDPGADAFRSAYAAAWPLLPQVQRVAGAASRSEPRYDLRVRYLGVWDTVGALGIPMLAAGKRAKPHHFHDLELSRAVLRARQAVAIDERRGPFEPSLWSNVAMFNTPDGPTRVEQKWFPGDHGGDGGGSVSPALSSGALLWIVAGAQGADLVFNSDVDSVLAAARRAADPVGGPLRDRVKGVDFNALIATGWRTGLATFDDVHESALLRWTETQAYRPKPLKPFAEQIASWRP
jgi:uncharacterized protein (DUF2235 family)